MRPRKRFGQHFLEPAWVEKLIAAIGPAATDRFLEIGPGRGAITIPLSSRVDRVLAVEIDRDLTARLQALALPHTTVVTGDVLDLPLEELMVRELGGSVAARIRIVGNLPYNVSSPVLFRLLDLAVATNAIRDATLMLQQEVAARLAARPGTREYGVLTVAVALGAEVTPLLALPPGAFRPPPKVRSTVARLTFRPPPVQTPDPALLMEIVRSIFTQRRKMLGNALHPFATTHGREAREALTAAGLDPRRRPETLELAELVRLTATFAR